MKCPKCLYIGFETGDRCKNCGYDFSLIETPELTDADPPELQIRDIGVTDEPLVSPAHDLSLSPGWAAAAVDRFRENQQQPRPTVRVVAEAALAPTPPEPPIDMVSGFPVTPPALALEFANPSAPTSSSVGAADPALPLFDPTYPEVDDEPLVKLPAAPRPPLAVRRTPDTPRMRPSTARPQPDDEAVLQFGDDSDDRDALGDLEIDDAADDDAPMEAPAPRTVTRPPGAPRLHGTAPSTIAARVAAAVIDHAILLGIDAAVLYFTLRLTGLELGEWRVLPLLPLLTFLVSLKVAYLSAFTAAGGQTIGKMATHIRVVSDDGRSLEPSRAFQRALLGLISIATFGAPFLPALTDPARRGVHDRAAGTRVVGLPTR